MDRRIAYIVIALLAALLFFLAIGYNGWGCGGSILGPDCIKHNTNKVTGALLLTAAFLVLIAGILLTLRVAAEYDWSETASAIIACIASILAMAGVFYYLDHMGIWSPFIATIAMSLCVAVAAILLFDLITGSE